MDRYRTEQFIAGWLFCHHWQCCPIIVFLYFLSVVARIITVFENLPCELFWNYLLQYHKCSRAPQ